MNNVAIVTVGSCRGGSLNTGWVWKRNYKPDDGRYLGMITPRLVLGTEARPQCPGYPAAVGGMVSGTAVTDQCCCKTHQGEFSWVLQSLKLRKWAHPGCMTCLWYLTMSAGGPVACSGSVECLKGYANILNESKWGTPFCKAKAKGC